MSWTRPRIFICLAEKNWKIIRQKSSAVAFELKILRFSNVSRKYRRVKRSCSVWSNMPFRRTLACTSKVLLKVFSRKMVVPFSWSQHGALRRILIRRKILFGTILPESPGKSDVAFGPTACWTRVNFPVDLDQEKGANVMNMSAIFSFKANSDHKNRASYTRFWKSLLHWVYELGDFCHSAVIGVNTSGASSHASRKSISKQRHACRS